MALIICPDCKHEVSDKAEACPHCGYPVKEMKGSEPAVGGEASPEPRGRKRARTTIWCVSLLIVVLGAVAVWYVFLKNRFDKIDERSMYDTIMRYEQSNQLDSLEQALELYFAMYNETDAGVYYPELKKLEQRFMPEHTDWKSVENSESIEDLRRFLDKHPDGFYCDMAKARMDVISYNAAKAENTKAAYEKYLLQYPDGQFADEAEKLIAELGLKELTEEEVDDVKLIITNHFKALADNNKAVVANTLAKKINSYIGKNDPTEEDVYDYMNRIHESGRELEFVVKDATVAKVEAGSGFVYNVNFELDEIVRSNEFFEMTGDEEQMEGEVKTFSGSAVLNSAMKITSLVLRL